MCKKPTTVHQGDLRIVGLNDIVTVDHPPQFHVVLWIAVVAVNDLESQELWKWVGDVEIGIKWRTHCNGSAMMGNRVLKVLISRIWTWEIVRMCGRWWRQWIREFPRHNMMLRFFSQWDVLHATDTISGRLHVSMGDKKNHWCVRTCEDYWLERRKMMKVQHGRPLIT